MPMRSPACAGSRARRWSRARWGGRRQVTQALAELQHVNQVHAKRGLQVISAWWALATSGEPAAEATVYTKRGRSRTKLVTGASSLEINI